jgi:hypothetical protein
MLIFVLTIRYKIPMYVYDIVMVVDKEILLKIVIY